MPCPTGLAECLVRIHMIGHPEEYGSGVLLQGGLILTCAHVIDRDYFDEVYGENVTGSKYIEANDRVRARSGQKVATARFYDDSEQIAELVAVDAVADMVLLRVAGMRDRIVRSPRIAAGLTLSPQTRLNAFGFARADRDRFTIRCSSISAVTGEGGIPGAYTKAFDGELSRGMSGGFSCHVDEHGVQLVGMNVLGDDVGNYTRQVRDRDILTFLAANRQATGAMAEFGHATEFGLADRFDTTLSPDGEPLHWLRMTPREHTLSQAGRSVCYLADRPLTAGEVDWLLGIDRSAALKHVRQAFFADFTRSEAEKVLELLAQATGLPLEIPRRDSLAALAGALSEPVATEDSRRLAASERNNLAANSADCARTSRGFRVFPDTRPEWQLARGPKIPDRVIYRGSQENWAPEGFLPIGANASMRAMLRPALRMSIWSDLA